MLNFLKVTGKSLNTSLNNPSYRVDITSFKALPTFVIDIKMIKILLAENSSL